MSLAILILLSFGLTTTVLWGALRSRLAHGLALDRPNERSLHAVPVPRIGGLVAIPSALGCALLANVPPLLPGLAASLCLFSYVDDRSGLAVGIRLAVHVGAALVVVATQMPDAHLPLVVLGVFAVGWMTNLFNFMDGSDGLAGGMALFGFGTMGTVAVMIGSEADSARLCFSLAASSAAFLLFNFHPARVFLGDAGSIPLGFLAGAIGMEGVWDGAWPFWFPILVFSPFIVDASVTLFKRAARGEKVWQAHREHYYQRLILLGWGHRKVALAEYALMAGASTLGFLMLGASSAAQLMGILIWGGGLTLLMIAIDQRWCVAAGSDY